MSSFILAIIAAMSAFCFSIAERLLLALRAQLGDAFLLRAHTSRAGRRHGVSESTRRGIASGRDRLLAALISQAFLLLLASPAHLVHVALRCERLSRILSITSSSSARFFASAASAMRVASSFSASSSFLRSRRLPPPPLPRSPSAPPPCDPGPRLRC